MADHDNTDEPNIRYAHDNHRLFNEQLQERQKPKTPDAIGPWLSNAAVEKLPKNKRDFDLSRDPFVRAQIQDRDAQRQNSAATVLVGVPGWSSATSRCRSRAPPENISRQVDRDAFRANWLAEQCQAAMSRAIHTELSKDQRVRTRTPGREPSQ